LPLIRRTVVRTPLAAAAVVLLALLAAPPLRAQTAPADPYRRALDLSLGVGPLPDAFTSQCGKTNLGGAGAGLGAGLVFRPRRGVILRADGDVTAEPIGSGCDLLIQLVEVEPGVFESRPGVSYPAGTPSAPLARTLLRAGIETPPGRLPLRATVGGGVVWGRRSLPLGAITLGTGTRGRRWRLNAELEHAVSRTSAEERRQRMRATPGGFTDLGTTVLRRVRYPRWTTLRLGVELPLAGGGR
jgi:hypothetical protein